MSLLLAGRRHRERHVSNRTAIAATGVLVLIVLIAVTGPWLTPYSPTETDLMATYSPPSGAHLLGTDEVGRDVLSRVVDGAQASLLGPLIVMLVAVALGTVVALVAAWFGGKVDSLIGVITDVNFAFPGLLLAVLASALFGPGLLPPAIAISIAYLPYCTRMIRSAIVGERALPYVEALRVQGLGGLLICVRHILPNVATTIVAIATLTFSYSMVDLAAISFLGLGTQPPDADWGSMVAQGQLGIQQAAPWQALSAGAFIVVTVVALNLLGERLVQKGEAVG
ncbi:peptide/nickel transport system permease protein [Kibdelosporangium banguiense]|uniref:Peptide/nickel transport system permease protein n=1 Tax=Kibdelosporangium banguiense TaxID=1365924 RepID=A0ABS4TS28_9PSEU|nr:ABC transporter permease [Kibdelosporangium banguiense]MBP2327207.1 peptide/nickel transport system permease protein [Kibdelosporangium banguiense]